MDKIFTRRLILTSLVLSSTIALGACEGPTDKEQFEDVRIHRQEIKGGQTDYDHPSIMGIYAAQGFAGGICTGTLIAPNLVLTAQHCVAEVPHEYVRCGETNFGDLIPARNLALTTNHTFTQDPSDYYSASRVHVPEEGSDLCGFDIALIVLSSPIPAEVALPITPRIDMPVQANEDYTAIGYGHTGSGRGSGTRRILDGRRVECDSLRCPSWTSVQRTEFLGTDGTCQGDSGGPAIDAQGRVLGALSRGPQGCAGSVYTSVARYGQWMREIGSEAASLGGYEEPRWVSEGISTPDPEDSDNDGIVNESDNCPEIANPGQDDFDEDNIGDACDDDNDNDGIANDVDNCPEISNADQADVDGDEFGDVCDGTDDREPSPSGNNENPDDENPDKEEEPQCVGFASDCNDKVGFVDSSSSKDSNCSTAPGQHGAPTGGLLLMGLGMVALAWRRRK